MADHQHQEARRSVHAGANPSRDVAVSNGHECNAANRNSAGADRTPSAIHAGGLQGEPHARSRADPSSAEEARSRGQAQAYARADDARAGDARAGDGEAALVSGHGTSARRSAAPDLDAARRRAVSEGARRAEGMADTIRSKIVPTLLSLSRAPAEGHREGVPAALVEAVAEAAVAGELAVVQSHLHSHTRGGASMADALITLIGGAAARLGEDWEEDTRDFMDVTIGLGTLQQVVLAVSDPDDVFLNDTRSILLGPAPGEDHTLGLAIVNHFFRQAQWSVAFMPYADRRDIVERVREQPFAVAGLSVASKVLLPAAAETVGAIRRASRNPQIKIMIGGPLVRTVPDLSERVGADLAVSDGRRAVEVATQWVEGGAESSAQTHA